jgi:SAM-dependent MidA family methyltransferase
MADMLRAAKVMPGFRESVSVHFVETSRRLREIQRAAVAKEGFTASWYDHFADVPKGPMFLAGNEFFDAIPIKQLEKRNGHWHERHVSLVNGGALGFVLSPDQVPAALVPNWAKDAEDQDIAEVAPVRSAIAAEMAERLVSVPGAAIFIDYGHAHSEPVDTLQAMRAHIYVDVFQELGLCDLTSHVDFEELGKAMAGKGAKVLPVITQGEFLRAMGIDARAQQLLRNATTEQRDAIEYNLNRLIAHDQMGELFKVMAAVTPGMPAPYPFPEP